MKILSLDLSTSTGWALFKDGRLNSYGKIVRKAVGTEKSERYPFNYIEMAEDIASQVQQIVSENLLDLKFVVIEETNSGRNRYHQKQLEFIHFAVVSTLLSTRSKLIPKIRYVDTSCWRSILNIGFNQDQRAYNREIADIKNQKRKEITDQIRSTFKSEIESKVAQCRLKRDQNKIIKEYDRKIKKLVGKEMSKFRAKVNGRMATKVNVKDLSVQFVNENFDLGFKRPDNDIADAICVGCAFIQNNYRSNKSN